MNLFEQTLKEECNHRLFIEQHFGSQADCDRILNEMLSMKGTIDYIRRKFGIGKDEDLKSALVDKLQQTQKMEPDKTQKFHHGVKLTEPLPNFDELQAYKTPDATYKYAPRKNPKKIDPDVEYGADYDPAEHYRELEKSLEQNSKLSDGDKKIIRMILNGDLKSDVKLTTYKGIK